MECIFYTLIWLAIQYLALYTGMYFGWVELVWPKDARIEKIFPKRRKSMTRDELKKATRKLLDYALTAHCGGQTIPEHLAKEFVEETDKEMDTMTDQELQAALDGLKQDLVREGIQLPTD